MRIKHPSSIHFKEFNFASEDLHLIEKDKRSRVKLDKPTFTDQTCLDKSKILLYLLYQFKPKYMNTIWQSLPLVETDDECKDISRDIEKWFDISS